MTFEAAQSWISAHPYVTFAMLLVPSYLLYRLFRLGLARALFMVAIRSETVYDDLIVDQLRPFRVAWCLPLGLIYGFSFFYLGRASAITNLALFALIVVGVDFLLALLSGINEIYKHRPQYSGVSVAAYIDVIKVLVIAGAVVLSISLFADVSPIVLLTGVGTWLAVLLLIFRDTILNFLASIQISSQELVREGDWIEVPGFGANGTVDAISLSAIKVKNSDNTFSIIPTHKLVEVAYKNYRGISESGGRRLKVSITVDMDSIKFCDMALLGKLAKYDLISDIVNEQIKQIQDHQLADVRPADFPLDGPQITNVQLYMKYAEAYLRTTKDIRQRRFPFLVRALQPGSEGLPIEIYVFTKNVDWAKFETIQSEVMIHLIAAAPYFGLLVYQQPGRVDVATLMAD